MTDAALQQRRDALRTANELRMARACIKRYCRIENKADARRTVASILRDVPPAFEGIKVEELLRFVPGISWQRASLLMHRIGATGTVGVEFVVVRHLSESQRADLADRVEKFKSHHIRSAA